MRRKIGFVLQARVGSTRFPGKVLIPIYEGKNIIEIIVNNLKHHFPEIPIVVATTANKDNHPIVKLAEDLNVHYFCGDEDNVLNRMVMAAKHFSYGAIVRICADNPMIQMDSIDCLIERFVDSELDYLSFKNFEGTPVVKTHFGLSAEIMMLNALEKAMGQTIVPLYLEHVTNYLYEHPKEFDVEFIPLPENILRRKDLRFTIDNQHDFELCQEIMNDLKEGVQDLNLLVDYVDKKGFVGRMITQMEKYQK